MNIALRFSLRFLLVFATVIAVAIVFVANYPFLTAMFLLCIGPLLMRIGAAPYVSAIAPRHVHWIVAVLQASYSFACGFCLLHLFPLAVPSWGVYIWLGTLSGVAIVGSCLAWARSDAISASKSGVDEAPSPGEDRRAI